MFFRFENEKIRSILQNADTTFEVDVKQPLRGKISVAKM